MIIRIEKKEGATSKDAVEVVKRLLRDDEPATILVIIPSNQGRYAGLIRWAKGRKPNICIWFASTVSDVDNLKTAAKKIIEIANNPDYWYHTYSYGD